MAYTACGGEYLFEGDKEVGDYPRPLEGRQLTVDIFEPLFLDVYLELLLLLILAVAIGVVVADWLDWRAFDWWLE